MPGMASVAGAIARRPVLKTKMFRPGLLRLRRSKQIATREGHFGRSGRTSQALFSTCDGTDTRPNASLAVRQGQDEEATDTLGYFSRPAEIGRPTMATEVDVLVKVFWQKENP